MTQEQLKERQEAFGRWLEELSVKPRWSAFSDEQERHSVIDFIVTVLPEIITLCPCFSGVSSGFEVTESTRWQEGCAELFANATDMDPAKLGMANRCFRLLDLFCQEEARRNSKKVKKASSSKKEKPDNLMPPQSQAEDADLAEGALRQVSLTLRERNREARQKCLDKYGYKCKACGFDFEAFYGEAGKEYIEVHHLTPIAATTGAHLIDSDNALVPLCSNCHSMIHRAGPDRLHPISLQALKDLIQNHGQSDS